MEYLQRSLLTLRWFPMKNQVRFRRVNIKNPRPPHYHKAQLLAVCRPIIPPSFKKLGLNNIIYCANTVKKNPSQLIDQNHPYMQILATEIRGKFENYENVFISHRNPTDNEECFQYKLLLHKNDMELKLYGKRLLQTALENTRFESVLPLFESPTNIIFSKENQVVKFVKLMKKMPSFVLMAGIIDGELLSRTQIDAYLQLPDIDIARAQLLNVLTMVPGQIVQHLNHHQTTMVHDLERLANPPKE